MSEALVSSAALNEYISSIDMTVIDNRKVLANVQVLNPNLLETIMYYLVIGKINISQLYTIDINNLSIKQFIAGLDASETIVNLRTFYKNKIKALPGYITFKNALTASASLRLSNMALSVDELMTTVIVDPLGGTGRYKSFLDVMNIYDSIVFSLPAQTKFNAVVTAANVLKNTYGFTGVTQFNETLLETITEYGLVASTTTLKSTLASNTILGFIARNMHETLTQTNVLSNINTVCIKMALNNALDVPKNGVYTLQQLMLATDYMYKSIFNIDYVSRGEAFLAQLSLISFVRKELYCNIYGANYFTPTQITAENNLYAAVLDYFRKLNSLSSYIQAQCKLLIASE
jgi:hypothetical protein